MILKRVAINQNTATTEGGAGGLLTRLGTVTINDTNVRTNIGIGIRQIGGNTTGNNITVFSNPLAGIETTTDSAAPSARASSSLNASQILQNLGGGFINRGTAGTVAQIVGDLSRQNQRTSAQVLADAPNRSGIANGEFNTLTVTDSAIEGNSGGSGAVANGGNAAFTRVTISGNTGTGFVNSSHSQHDGAPRRHHVRQPGQERPRRPPGAPRPHCLGDVIGRDPLPNPLGGEPGKPQSQTPKAGSPAIDASDNAECANTPRDGNGGGMATCDIGAVEAPAVSAPPSPFSPHPHVRVSVANNGDGCLKVTVSAGHGTLQKLKFAATTKALVENAGTPTEVAGGVTFAPPANTTQVTFFVRRAAAGSAATVPLTITDGCDPWPTLVGGGMAAF